MSDSLIGAMACGYLVGFFVARWIYVGPAAPREGGPAALVIALLLLGCAGSDDRTQHVSGPTTRQAAVALGGWRYLCARVGIDGVDCVLCGGGFDPAISCNWAAASAPSPAPPLKSPPGDGETP